MSYQCPLCQHPLQRQGQIWLCGYGHQFDCAKEGYVNLLPVQHKRSSQPGDNREMMQARRHFLNEGHYQLLQQRVCKLLAENLPPGPLSVLDMGCGEGYYTGAVADTLADKYQARVYGLDISRDGMRLAARCYKAVNFCVASGQRLPFITGSLDGILRIYAPCNPAELSRVVKPDGLLLTVTPGPRHLLQLRELIYQEVKLHDITPEVLPGWHLTEEHTLGYPMTLASESALMLLQMTPLAWRARPEIREHLATSDIFTCETDFMLRLWRRQL